MCQLELVRAVGQRLNAGPALQKPRAQKSPGLFFNQAWQGPIPKAAKKKNFYEVRLVNLRLKIKYSLARAQKPKPEIFDPALVPTTFSF